MPKLKSIIPKIRNHIYYLSLTFLGMAMALITTIIVTRSLSIIDRSDYGIATVALMQILMVSQLGLPGAFGITGPAPFRKFGFRKFLKLYLLRTFWFLLTILIFTAFYQGNFLVAMFAFLNALLLIPSQWAMNALQKTIARNEFFLLRLTPTCVQFILVLSLIILKLENLRNFLLVWIIGNLVFLLACFVILKREITDDFIDDSPKELSDIVKLGYAGFIPHVSIQEILRIEILLLPLLKDPSFIASYFVIVGVATWPKAICDSVAVANFPIIQSLVEPISRKRFLQRISMQVRVLLLTSFLVNFFVMLGLRKLYPSEYTSIIWAILPLTISSVLSSSRRLYLDMLRSQSKESAIRATKIELLSFLPILVCNFLLFSNLGLVEWTYCLVLASYLGFSITINRVKAYEKF